MLELVLIVLVIALQTTFGYLENKKLGAILPVLSILLFVYLFVSGVIEFSVIDILLPLVGLFALVSLWENGRKSKYEKRKKELEKMKAKDSQQ